MSTVKARVFKVASIASFQLLDPAMPESRQFGLSIKKANKCALVGIIIVTVNFYFIVSFLGLSLSHVAVWIQEETKRGQCYDERPPKLCPGNCCG